MTTHHATLTSIVIGAAAVCFGLFATGCGSEAASTVTPTAPPITTPPTTAPAAPAAAPRFLSFSVSPSATCESGNATFTMAYTTKDIDGMSISIGGKRFAQTAGYGPDETGVIASVPCSGAGSSSIQMKGCNTNGACAESDKVAVTIAA